MYSLLLYVATQRIPCHFPPLLLFWIWNIVLSDTVWDYHLSHRGSVATGLNVHFICSKSRNYCINLAWSGDFLLKVVGGWLSLLLLGKYILIGNPSSRGKCNGSYSASYFPNSIKFIQNFFGAHCLSELYWSLWVNTHHTYRGVSNHLLDINFFLLLIQ